MIGQRKIERKTETATEACACCGTRAVLSISATVASLPVAGAPVSLCAGCIVALARALADDR